MSDDWVKNYIQDKKNKQRKADLAEAGAPGVLQKIQDRIRHDLQIFHDNGRLTNLQVNHGSKAGSFDVSSSESPSRTMLRIELSIVLVNCLYVYEENGQSRVQSATLRICSDLDGNMQVYEEGKLIAVESDVSEVSEFLLKPLLNFIDS